MTRIFTDDEGAKYELVQEYGHEVYGLKPLQEEAERYYHIGDMVRFNKPKLQREMWRGPLLLTGIDANGYAHLLNAEGDGTTASPRDLELICTCWEAVQKDQE